MAIDIQLVYIFILLFTCIVLICLVLLGLYLQVLSKYTNIRTAGVGEKTDLIVKNAEKVATEIITNAKDLDRKFDQAIEKTIDQITSKWSKEADIVFSKNVKNLENNLVAKLNEIYKNENDSLESYKKTKVAEFESNLSTYVKKLAKEILKKEIDMDTHKRLIKDSLEKAVKNGLFN